MEFNANSVIFWSIFLITGDYKHLIKIAIVRMIEYSIEVSVSLTSLFEEHLELQLVPIVYDVFRYYSHNLWTVSHKLHQYICFSCITIQFIKVDLSCLWHKLHALYMEISYINDCITLLHYILLTSVSFLSVFSEIVIQVVDRIWKHKLQLWILCVA